MVIGGYIGLWMVIGGYIGLSGPASTILDWYGHCMRFKCEQARGVWGHAPQEN